MTLIMAVVIGYAGWRARQGGMTVGAFVAFMAALGVASQSLRQLASGEAQVHQRPAHAGDRGLQRPHALVDQHPTPLFAFYFLRFD